MRQKRAFGLLDSTRSVRTVVSSAFQSVRAKSVTLSPKRSTISACISSDLASRLTTVQTSFWLVPGWRGGVRKGLAPASVAVRSRSAATLLMALAGYAAVIAWLTWPLAANLGTHLAHTTFICDIDLRQMVWALSWQTHALTTAPSQFYEANLYHPTPHALLYADAGIGALPYFAPTFLLTGNPTLAANVMFLGSIALTACLLHLVVARWTGLASAGLVAAGTVLTTRWILWTWVPAAPNYGVLQALPLIIYLASSRVRSNVRTALLALLVVLHGMTNPYYAASALATLGVLAGLRLLAPSG